VSEALALRRDRGGVRLGDHLEAVRLQDLKDVYAFWSGGEPPELPKREITRQLAEVMADEGTVYRRVRTLTRKVLDVLLLLLRRADYRSDLPGLFRRMPGEEAVALEYHEAEAALRALVRRGFVGEWADRSSTMQGRSLYAVPLELGDILAGLFREETRTVRSVFSLAGFAASLGATDRRALAAHFPGLSAEPGPEDVAKVLGEEGGPGRLLAVEPEPLRVLARRALDAGGILLRSEAGGREGPAAGWDRRAHARALESAGAGTVARLSLGEYGIACDDEALVLFHEVVEDALRRAAPSEPDADEVLRPGGDLVSDLLGFLGEVRRQPIRLTREGEVHKAAQRRIEDGFVFRESSIAGAPEVWAEIRSAADHLGLVAADREGFLACRDEAERWAAQSLDAKVAGLYRLALEAAGPRGRSLHLCEMRQVVGDLLKEEPGRWWTGDSLFVVARLRYLATLDARRIRERHRDRHFGAYVATRAAPRDLLLDLARSWRRTLYLLGMVDVAVRGETPTALRLSTLGARVLGVAPAETGGPARSLLVSPDFEVVVLPEGDVADAVHHLGGFAQRVKSGEVVHFRFTKETIEAATAEGRRVEDLLAWLAQRARGPVPQNVAVSLKDWAAGVAFATLEKGIVLRLERPTVMDAVLALPGMKTLLVRRLSPTEALLRDEPKDRRLLAALRGEGVYLEGP
jgi:hypothetical protein